MVKIKKMIIPMLAFLCIVSTSLMTVILWNISKTSKKEAVFIPPNFDVEAIRGKPQPPQELEWSELYKEGMRFKVGICGKFVADGNTADVFFSNSAENEVWLKLRVFDEQNNIISETGLIKPNEYIKSVKFNRTVLDGEKIKIKVMAYEPETYYSEASIVLNTIIK